MIFETAPFLALQWGQTTEFEEETMDRLAAFEAMLSEIQKQAAYEMAQMEKLKAEGKEKSATYRQYFGNKLIYKSMLELYRKYQLID